MRNTNNFKNGIKDSHDKKFNPPSEGTSKTKAAAIGTVILGVIGGPVGVVIGGTIGVLAGDSNRQLKRKKSNVIKYKTGHNISNRQKA